MLNLTALLSEKRVLLADGAMGTYFAARTDGNAQACEAATLANPHLIEDIHAQYVAAGAQILRTNTFALTAQGMGISPGQLSLAARRAVALARKAGRGLAAVALSLGPLPHLEEEDALADQRVILEAALVEGIDILWFETQASLSRVIPLAQAARCQADVTIMVSFNCSADGLTAAGLPVARLMSQAQATGLVDMLGLNCGLGPTHMLSLAAALGKPPLPLALLPNAGYPELGEDRIHYTANPAHFSHTLAQATPMAAILGGCCGTTPAHIAALREALREAPAGRSFAIKAKTTIRAPAPGSRYAQKLARNGFITLVELAPPKHADIQGFLSAARKVQLAGADGITVPDGPMARSRMSSVIAATLATVQLGVEAIPHLACRDRNLNALRGDLLGAHAAGIRGVLAITGDAVPECDRGHVRPVFNLSAIQLAGLIQSLNQSAFEGDPMAAAVAFNPGAANIQAELGRLKKKQDQGAVVALTQPLFDPAHLEGIAQARATGMRVLAGILPLVSQRNALYLHHEVPGIRLLPQHLAAFTPEQSKEAGIEIGLTFAQSMATLARDEVDGFYFMAPFGRADIIVSLMTRLQATGVLA